MKRFKLKKSAKIAFILIAILAIVGGLFATGFGQKVLNFAKKDVSSVFNKNDSTDDMYKKAGEIKKEDGTINISLDEWVGWKSIIDANGGLHTAKDSIYDKLGVKLNISVINDATQSSDALIKGDLDGAGYTVNRYAFLYNKFQENKTPVKMGFITNSSNGGDGIIAKKGINRVEDLVGKKIGVPRYSEAQTLVEWLLQKSTLTDAQIKDIRKNMVMFDTPDDAAKAFYAGQLDAAATWQPYLSQATETVDAHVLFSTKDATNIIMDGIVFRQDFIDSHKETVSKLLEGALQAQPMYDKDAKAIAQTFPMFATQTDKETLDMTGDAQLYNCSSNAQALDNGTAVNLFRDMSTIWASVGEKADPENATKAFDPSFAKDLLSKFPNDKVQKPTFSDDEKKTAQSQDDKQALLSQKLSITFETNSASIAPESYAALQEFYKTANILNGTVIQIEGNTDNTGDTQLNQTHSEKRARSISMYLQSQGLDPSRFVVVGNGSSKPIADNNTEEGRAANRRTDVYFKAVK
jgi:NitT/TauT family transport system substrate-binding protein